MNELDLFYIFIFVLRADKHLTVTESFSDSVQKKSVPLDSAKGELQLCPIVFEIDVKIVLKF